LGGDDGCVVGFELGSKDGSLLGSEDGCEMSSVLSCVIDVDEKVGRTVGFSIYASVEFVVGDS
jgi:hypothetical protein